MILVQPQSRRIIRKNPMYPNDSYVVLDHIEEVGYINQEAETQGNIHSAFITFLNDNKITRSKWVALPIMDIEKAFVKAEEEILKGNIYEYL